jgi:hypothetical protein
MLALPDRAGSPATAVGAAALTATRDQRLARAGWDVKADGLFGVVAGAGFEAAVQDAAEAAGDLAQGGCGTYRAATVSLRPEARPMGPVAT